MAEKSNEWYTPARYIEAARLVMGSIDLDPASCELANQTVKATKYFTEQENGLAQSWYGRVWLNPPFKFDRSLPIEQRSTVGKWTRRLISEFQAGNVEQAILLSTAQSNASWFDLLWEFPICFSKRVWFDVPFSSKGRPGKTKDTIMWGTIFVYLGKNEQKFINTFSQFGRIAKAIDTPRRVEKPIPLWDVERIYA